jgi:hypothetical protein
MNAAYRNNGKRGDIIAAFDEAFSKLYVGRTVTNAVGGLSIGTASAVRSLIGRDVLPYRTIDRYYTGQTGFAPEFQEKTNNFNDQTHHFATYLTIGIHSLSGGPLWLEQRFHRLRDNQADADLGKAGYNLGQMMVYDDKHGWNVIKNIGVWIREFICDDRQRPTLPER